MSPGRPSPSRALSLEGESEWSDPAVSGPSRPRSLEEDLPLQFFSLLGARNCRATWQSYLEHCTRVPRSRQPFGVTALAGVWACLEVHRPEAGTPSFPPASHSHGCGPSLHTGHASHDLNSALPPKASPLGGGGSRPCPSAFPPLAHGTCPQPTLCLRAGFIHGAVYLPLGGLVTESFPWVSGSSGPKYRAA